MPPTHQWGPRRASLRPPPQRPPVSWPSVSFSCDACLWTRQVAEAFNQPLSFDTSSVTDMASMFSVRSARALRSVLTVGAFLHAACTAAASPRPPATRPAPHPSVLSLFTRQNAKAFNQPLSFDTSSVTNMLDMFMVRSARALPSSSTVGPLPARCLHRRRFYTPSRLPARMSPFCFPSYIAGHGRVVRREQAPHPLCVVGQLRVCQPVRYGVELFGRVLAAATAAAGTAALPS